MKRSLLTTLSCALVLSACSHHPLDGAWGEVRADGKDGYWLKFATGGDRLDVHGRARADGTHDHMHGTYRLEGAELTAEWADDLGAKTQVRGTVAGDLLHLQTGSGEALEFRRGEHDDH